MAATSQRSNLEIVKSAYEGFNAGDMEATLATFDEDIEWIEPDGGRYAGTHHGPQAVLEGVFSQIATEYEQFAVDPERFVEDGDTIVVLGTTTATTRETGTEMSSRFAHVCDMEDGKLVRFTDFQDTAMVQQAFES